MYTTLKLIVEEVGENGKFSVTLETPTPPKQPKTAGRCIKSSSLTNIIACRWVSNYIRRLIETIMKSTIQYLKSISVILISFTVLLIACKKEFKTVFVTSTISVDLPVDYQNFVSHSTSSVITNPDVKKEHKNYNYRARINNDEVFITNLITDEFDTLNLGERLERINRGCSMDW
jgi:hypothetical protein